jgi:hypothetical protein
MDTYTTATAVRQDSPVTTENPWGRLTRIAKRRMRSIGMTQPGMAEAGGPSVGWFTKLPHHAGEPSSRQREMLDLLDEALRWPAGTSWDLLTVDRSAWPDFQLADEEEGLVALADEFEHFAFIVEKRLRAMDSEGAQDLIRRIKREMGLPVEGD